MGPFQPMYIFPTELTAFGLPTSDIQSDIQNLVGMASSLIDIHCGRVDGDGLGSLVYTTYTQRVLLQTRNRNLIQLNAKPIVGLLNSTVAALQAQASGAPASGNYFYTGVQANTLNAPNGALSGLVAASGRYGYGRQDLSTAYPDLYAFINPLNLVTMFGGPAPWVAIDITNTDYDSKFGEVWIPAGLQLQKYSEVIMQYNSGYDPNAMPNAIKYVCAAMVKNALAKGDGTTAMLSFNMAQSGANATFANSLIDPTLQSFLQPFCSVRCY
jgi:hypothetical protein